jgi:endonuclease/exonuclease/phosphatase family protein
MIALKLLFWNVGGTAKVSDLAALVEQEKPEVVILAENPSSVTATVEALNAVASRSYHLTFNLSPRLQFFVAMPPDRFESLLDEGGVAARRLSPIIGDDIIIVAVHLPSKLHLTDNDQALLTTRLANSIEELEARVGHDRTVVIGDLNMNPFEQGVVSSEGLHAVMSRTIATRGGRVVMGRHRKFFYNPMWRFFGDADVDVRPGGTCYYASSAPIAYFWHVFDQVLLRPDLAERVRPGDVSIVKSIADRTLLNSAGVPDRKISDHLPIVTRIWLTEEANNGREESLGSTSFG